MTDPILPSWRPGPIRDALVEFLGAADEISPEQRLAVFDNDGTLWCEKLGYSQLDFFVWQLQHAVGDAPGLRDVPEYQTLLRGETAATAEFGPRHVGLALLGLLQGNEPDVFEERVQTFFDLLEYTASGIGPCLAPVVSDDDAEREYAYESEAGSFVAQEYVSETAARLGWTQISTRDDWDRMFPR